VESITTQKPFEEIQEMLEDSERIYIIGCGTCATTCQTGGKAQVLAMKEKLKEMGKTVTGWMVIPTTCDDMTKEALETATDQLDEADGILVMSCAFGVQTVANFASQPVYPALNTLFMGKEETPGHFSEICRQCGDCTLAWTGGICPVTACPKGLVNGPCGGTNDGKCEVDREKDCAWTLIYQKLEKQGRLDLMRRYRGPRNFQAVLRPGKKAIT
jgi:ferredoxin